MSQRPNILVFLTDDHGQWASRYPAHGRTWRDEFYDLQEDSRETRSCLDAPVVAELSRRLDEYFTRYEVAAHAGKAIDRQRDFNLDMPWRARP